jgi:hypothetical protein
MLEWRAFVQLRLRFPMNQTAAGPSPFVSLLIGLATEVGLESRADPTQPLVLEFEASSHTCRVIPHSGDSDRLVIEVMVRYLGESAEDLTRDRALLMHRLNAQARLNHGWVATVDESDHLVIWQTLEIARTRAADLQAWLVEGIERAQALDAIWAGGGSDSQPDRGDALRVGFAGLRA